MNEPRYRQPDENDRETLLALSREAVGMTDVYTYVSLHPALPQDSRLWLAENGTEITCVLYDDGAYYTRNELADGSFAAVRTVHGVPIFAAPRDQYRLVLMEGREEGKVCENVVPLTGKELLGVLRLMSDTQTLPDYLEKRYVDIVRGINAGLCSYLGVYEDGALVSCGGIAASNEKYALIGNIFTREDRRGRGLASGIVNALAKEARRKGLVPILYCEKQMSGFYRRLGFYEKER